MEKLPRYIPIDYSKYAPDIPEDQLEAFETWRRLPTAERDRKVDPAPSVPAPIIEKADVRAEKRQQNAKYKIWYRQQANNSQQYLRQLRRFLR